MYHRRQTSSTSARSNLSNTSFLSTSPPNPLPVSLTFHQSNRTSSTSTSGHKRNRFKTLFFIPSIRDSGISLNAAATSDPRFPSPLTPPSYPIPAIPTTEPLLQDELDFVVDELTARFQWDDKKTMDFEYRGSDRCDSPTLGSSSGLGSDSGYGASPGPAFRKASRHDSRTSTWTHPSAAPTPLAPSKWLSANPPPPTTSRPEAQKRQPPLPGASHPNTPAHTSNPRAQKTYPRLGLPQPFKRLAITDPNINGQPIRFLSPDFVSGTNSLKIGSCTFLNLAYGVDVECGLRIEPLPSKNSKNKASTNTTSQEVILQIVQRVVRVKDGASAWLLCSETDVTSSFTADVQVELSAAAAASTHPLEKYPHNESENDTDIWIQLAQTLDTPTPYAPTTTTPLPLHTTAPTTHPALHDLLSLLTELRFLHRQVFLLHPLPSASASTSTPDFSIPYLSSSLHNSLVSLTPPAQTTLYDPATNRNIPAPAASAPQDLVQLFISACTEQARKWVGDTPGAAVLRETLSLPRLGRGKAEKLGVFGVWCGEDTGFEGQRKRQSRGVWVCFLVPAGVEGVV